MKSAFSLWIALIGFGGPFCLNAQVITTFAGTGTSGYSGNQGPAVKAELSDALGVCADPSGNIYIADHANHVIRKVDKDGIISNFAGTGSFGYSGDGGPAINAQLEYPYGLYADKQGNVYFTDRLRCVVRKIDSNGIIITVAGVGISGFSGDGGPAVGARLHSPMGICGDGDGNLYIVEFVNWIVRKVNSEGKISTFAGNRTLGYSGDDGLAVNAQFNSPVGISADKAGNIYIADTDNAVVRKISTSGTISTVAGNGTMGYSGDGGHATAAQLKSPYGVYVNGSGELYIGDAGNAVVRKVNASGIITTIAGNGIKGNAGDGGAPTIAQLNFPAGICEDSNGNLYITDALSHVIRKIGPCIEPVITAQPDSVALCEGDSISLHVEVHNATHFQWQVNTGNAWNNLHDDEIYSGTAASKLHISKAGAGMGNYRYQCITANACNADTSQPVVLKIADPAAPFTASIQASSNPVCTGSAVVFTAMTTNGSGILRYEWLLNGMPAGSNSPAFETTAIGNDHVVSCRITDANTCAANNTAVSNTISMQVLPAVVPAISIAASDNEICEGALVSYTASPVNEGDSPHYRWQLNGMDTGTDSIVYSTNLLKSGDVVTCMLTSSFACTTPVSSGNSIITVHPNTPVSFDPPEILIKHGSGTTLSPLIEGTPLYYQWAPAPGLNNASIREPFASPSQTTTYQLQVTSADGCTSSAYVTVKIYRSLQMPTAFTPDNNGKNDIFRIHPDISLKLHHFSVYNRWGQKIFATSDITKGWDGKKNNRLQAEGIYVWVISYENLLTGQAITEKGSFTLIQ